MNATRARGEEGSLLVISLLFITGMGMFVAVLASLAVVNLKTTGVVQTRTERLYAVDGGIDYGIQLLRDDPSLCAQPTATAEGLPGFSVNAQAVDVTCRTLEGQSGAGAGDDTSTPPLVVTGYAHPGGSTPDHNELVRVANDKGNTVTVGAAAFNAGGFKFAGDTPTFVFEQDLGEKDPFCTVARSAAVTPQVNGTWTCLPSSSAVPDPDPTVKVPTVTAPGRRVVGSCTIYFPGKYTSSNKPTFSSGNRYYFASGVYYFEDTGEIQFEGQVFGGQPGAGESQQINSITPCADDTAANALRPGTASGSGVIFVLGGTSRVKVASSTSNKVELYARQPANPALEGTAGVSIHAPKTAGTGYKAWSELEAFVTDNVEPTVVVHGLVYVPKAKTKIWAMPNVDTLGRFIFGAGLVTSSLEIATSDASIGAVLVAVAAADEEPTARRVVITAAVQGATPGTHATTARAVVILDPDGSAAIESWRVA
jgi:hypothetical protein